LKKDLILTFFTQIFVLISTLLIYRFAKNHFGEIGFTTYSLTRRNVAFLLPAFSMGLGVALPKYIAFSIGENTKKENIFFVSGLIIVSIVILLLVIITFLTKDKLAFLLYGNVRYSYFIFPIFISISGTLYHFIAYSYFRGRLEMVQANLLQFINLGIIPIFSFFLSSKIQEVFLFNGISIFFISLVAILIVLRNRKSSLMKNEIVYCGKELIGYGIQRVPGDFGLAAFFSLPAIIYSHVTDIETAGYVAFGISLLNMVGQIFAPIGQIYLPKISGLIAQGNSDLVKSYTNKLLIITVLLTVSGIIVFELFPKFILELYLGNVNNKLIFYTRTIILAALGFAIYVSMRSIIDAVYKTSYNSINIIISLLIFILLSVIVFYTKLDCVFFIIAFITGLFFLSILTLRKIYLSNINVV